MRANPLSALATMIDDFWTFFAEQVPWVQSLIGFLLLGLAALAANFLLKQVILRAAAPWLDRRSNTVDRAAARLANVVPALIVAYGVHLVPNLPEAVEVVIENVAMACIVFSIAFAVSGMLSYANEIYERRPEAKTRPIKGYVQVLKILVFCAATILAIAVLIQQSPLLLLSGLGAMAAVLLLVFKDTILSLVASVQLSSNDMLRVGDWITMPDQNADGDVIDIALHTVKVQNFDKTIVTIPTYKLIGESFINWRGMKDSGGRRIKRAIPLDQNSIRFLTEEEIARFKRFKLLENYIKTKEWELSEYNGKLENGSDAVNSRRITNIGTFRAYIVSYLRSHKRVTKNLTMMVRQLEPGPQGVPIEIYCFAGTTVWQEYEGIQSDIFDHLLAILPEFGLRVFQEPSGMDLHRLRVRPAPEQV